MHRKFEFQRAINNLTALIYAVKDVVRAEVPEEVREKGDIPRDMAMHVQAFQECLKTARNILSEMQNRKAELIFKENLEILEVRDINPRIRAVLKDVLTSSDR